MILNDIEEIPKVGQGIETLTPRQLEVVSVLSQGNSNKQTAILLSISVNAVKGHVRRSCQKINVENRVQLIVAFTKWQMIMGEK